MTAAPAVPPIAGPPVRLAILTVTRDNLPGLLDTHASLKRQSVRDFHWLVADGGSTDGTVAWLTDHTGALAWWRSAPDGGPYGGMNDALDAARALNCTHALFLNAGDSLAEADTLLRLRRAMQHAPDAVLLYGDALERTDDDRLLLKVARSHRLATLGMFTHHQAMIYRIAGIEGLRFDPSFEIAADYGFTLTTLRRGAATRLPFPVCVFARGGLSQQKIEQGRREQSQIRRLFFGHGLALETLVSSAQWAASALRIRAPAVYEFFRFRRKKFYFHLRAKTPPETPSE
ncbi:glycosyltransferase [Azospirillum griseum]|uniref:Glycosyltransferase n=1 Tax=Azospirillum griseum TaxID=2496639 RepID=A0A3S0HUT9_9PROT|nr:glycosyltransferase [Azospirillum griseum]RTR16568.1 glycosyltransferase [Azospirillum griseum]